MNDGGVTPMVGPAPADWNEYAKGRNLPRHRLCMRQHRFVLNDWLDFCCRVSPGARVLDVGCGDGLFLCLAEYMGLRAEGLDPSEVSAERCRQRGLQVRVGSVESLDCQDEYDLVLLMDVLEHLQDPLLGLRAVHRALAPGGLLYLTVPIVESFACKLYRWTSGASRLDQVRGIDETHLHAFTRRGLDHMIASVGFGVGTHRVFSNRWPRMERVSRRMAETLQGWTGGRCGDLLRVSAVKQQRP